VQRIEQMTNANVIVE